MVGFFNKKLDINRFFIEDSEGQTGTGDAMPKVEFGHSDEPGASTGFNDNSDPFEDALEDALCVFKSGDVNSDIVEKNEKLIMFYVDLENEMIINKQIGNEENKERQDGESGDQISESKHPVLFNQYPVCQTHSLFLLFADAGLPQVLSDELLVLMLQIFKVSDQPSFRLGYNSMGADCIANNLHFHMTYADQMFKDVFGDKGEVYPIENAGKKLFFRTTLQHRNKEEINMYNCAVRFGEIPGWPVKTLILSPDIDESNEEASLEDAQEALAHTAGIVLNYLIDMNIPHNILIADEGMTLYIIPRKFDLLIENVSFFTSFETLCGFIKFKTEKAYTSSTNESITEQLKESVSVGEEDFERMKTELIDKFMKEYEGATIN